MDRLADRRVMVAACVLMIGLSAAGRDHAIRPVPFRVVYVDDDATGANVGTSWADAFVYLQDALAVARRGDRIRVAQGVYKPDQGAGISAGDREATFYLVSDVTLAGGYAGLAGGDPDERDIERYETILTGDLNGDDNEVTQAHHLSDLTRRGDNSVSVVVADRVVASVLDGFTIRDGHAPEITGGHATDGGGGLRIIGGSLIVRRCTFTRNWGPEGGAMFIRHARGDMETLSEIHDSRFLVNASGESGGLRIGHGLLRQRRGDVHRRG